MDLDQKNQNQSKNQGQDQGQNRSHQAKATHQIEDLVKAAPTDRIAIADLMGAMEGAGFGLTLMIFSFGIIIPLPPPFPSIIAVPLAIFSYQMMVGLKAPRLPKRFAKMEVKRSVLVSLVRRSSPYISKVERVLRPRLIFMMSLGMERFLGGCSFVFAVFVLIPLPLSNFIPGLGILIMSFGLTSRDGLVVILGVLVGFLGMVISVAAVFVGLEVLGYLRGWLGI